MSRRPMLLDVQRHLQQNIQAFLNTHGSHVPDEVALAVLSESGFGGTALKVFKSGPLRTMNTSVRIEAVLG